MIKRFIFTAVVVTDLQKSVKFYRDILGGEVVGTSKNRSKGAAAVQGFDVDEAEFDAYFIRFGGEDKSTIINVIQWISPPSTGKIPNQINHMGVNRLGLQVDDIDKTYNELVEKGVKFINPPHIIEMDEAGSRKIKAATCHDPDGLSLELIQMLPRGS